MEVDDPPSIGVAMPPPSARPQPAATAQKAEAQQQQLQMLEDPAVTALRAAVAANPASYEAHLSLVQTLRAAEEAGTSTAAAAVAQAREAREAFAAAFPLSPELWAEWIADETAAAQKDQLYCKGLYERAFKDYQCAALWPGYLALLESLCDAEVGHVLEAARLKEGFEAALTAVGIHMTVGPDIWSQYRTYEKDELEDLQVCIRQAEQQALATSMLLYIQQMLALGSCCAGTALLTASLCSQQCDDTDIALFCLIGAALSMSTLVIAQRYIMASCINQH
eukprot:17740-Heterococcus_DN1.PRE.2